MEDFLRFFGEELKDKYYSRFDLNIYFSHITDWSIRILDLNNEREVVVYTQDCDMKRVFAKAQVEFKEWLCEHEGGY